jgi:hypothetical protein
MAPTVAALVPAVYPRRGDHEQEQEIAVPAGLSEGPWHLEVP